jgi:hypothetical protein
MFIFLEASNVTTLQYYFIKKFGLEYSQNIQKFPNNLSILQLDRLSDLETILLGESIFFEKEAGISKNIKLINLGELEVNSNAVDYLKTFQNLDEIIYFYSDENERMNPKSKKFWLNLGYVYEVVAEITKLELKNIFTEIDKHKNLNLSEFDIQDIIKNSNNLDELLNNIFLIEHGKSPKLIIDSITKSKAILPFMLNFNITNSLTNPKDWLNFANNEENQMALSIIYGKLQNQNSPKSKILQKKLVKTDHNIKTNTKLPASVWYKYFIWEATQN